MIKRSSLIIIAILMVFTVLFGCTSFLLSDEVEAKTSTEYLQPINQEKDYTLILDITGHDEYEVDQIIGRIIYDRENLYDGTVLKCKGQYLQMIDKPYCSFIRENVGCPNGIEFILKDGVYPQEHDLITIQGTIEHYKYTDELGYENTGVHLVDTIYTE